MRCGNGRLLAAAGMPALSYSNIDCLTMKPCGV